MWLFTKSGFITAVNARQGDGDRRNPVDPDSAEALKAAFGKRVRII